MDSHGSRSWEGKVALILGLARQGKALARYLTERGASVVVSDLKSPDSLSEALEELSGLPIEYALGGHPPGLLEGVDALCLSGGVPADMPLAIEARRRGLLITNDAQLLLEACPAPVTGITGSAGKSTTTDLVGGMAMAEARRNDRRAWVGGNIGNPLLGELERIRPNDLVVMELSSFQLELMSVSPAVAAVLNVTPNHLDRHHSMEAYVEAKARILAFQGEGDVAVLGRENPGAWEFRDRVLGDLVSFGRMDPVGGDGTYLREDSIWVRRGTRDELVVPIALIQLRGDHNLLNVLAACAIASAAGISVEAMAEGIEGYQGMPHRLEFVRQVRGVDWYNDSIATAPERALAAIRSFEEPIVLLAGGRDKDLPWGEFAVLVRQRVDHLVLFGEAREKIAKAIGAAPGADRPFTIESCETLDRAVEAASRVAEPGDVVLLAPGGTSFDEFPDFTVRGERFRALVEAL